MSEELTLLPCPFCGSRDVEVQGKPAILDALDSVCCNECTADAPHPVWNTRAQLPSQGGEAVAWRVTGRDGLTVTTQYPEWAEADCLLTITPLYTHPANQRLEGEVKRLRDALATASDYLDGNQLSSIASGSTCHRKMKTALSTNNKVTK